MRTSALVKFIDICSTLPELASLDVTPVCPEGGNKSLVC